MLIGNTNYSIIYYGIGENHENVEVKLTKKEYDMYENSCRSRIVNFVRALIYPTATGDPFNDVLEPATYRFLDYFAPAGTVDNSPWLSSFDDRDSTMLLSPYKFDDFLAVAEQDRKGLRAYTLDKFRGYVSKNVNRCMIKVDSLGNRVLKKLGNGWNRLVGGIDFTVGRAIPVCLAAIFQVGVYFLGIVVDSFTLPVRVVTYIPSLYFNPGSNPETHPLVQLLKEKGKIGNRIFGIQQYISTKDKDDKERKIRVIDPKPNFIYVSFIKRGGAEASTQSEDIKCVTLINRQNIRLLNARFKPTPIKEGDDINRKFVESEKRPKLTRSRSAP